MLTREEKIPDENKHPNMRKSPGCVMGYRDRVMFLNPGDVFTDHYGRKYQVFPDGSVRKVRKLKGPR